MYDITSNKSPFITSVMLPFAITRGKQNIFIFMLWDSKGLYWWCWPTFYSNHASPHITYQFNLLMVSWRYFSFHKWLFVLLWLDKKCICVWKSYDILSPRLKHLTNNASLFNVMPGRPDTSSSTTGCLNVSWSSLRTSAWTTPSS